MSDFMAGIFFILGSLLLIIFRKSITRGWVRQYAGKKDTEYRKNVERINNIVIFLGIIFGFVFGLWFLLSVVLKN